VIPIPILRKLCAAAKFQFEREPMLLTLHQDCIIVGDLHGHILDLLRIFEEFGVPPRKRYLFLGDFVDRGEFSTETIILLLCLKALWPSSVGIIRGNHEFRDMWHGGFAQELKSLYPKRNVTDLFESVFAVMPVAAIVNKSIICVHGGIGPSIESTKMIESMPRPLLTFDNTIACELLWSDPSEGLSGFLPSCRGLGYKYGKTAVIDFLESNGLDLLVRGHECLEKGFRYSLGGRVATVFSASSYCNSMNNCAAVLQVYKDGSPPKTHYFQPIPYVKRASACFLESESEYVLLLDTQETCALSRMRALSEVVPSKPKVVDMDLLNVTQKTAVSSDSLPGLPKLRCRLLSCPTKNRVGKLPRKSAANICLILAGNAKALPSLFAGSTSSNAASTSHQ
jgi:protein phosphatase